MSLEVSLKIPCGKVILDGDLVIPQNAKAVVLFAHGSGSSRKSPRNRFVAGVLQKSGLATLLFDLLTREEETEDNLTRALRFDIPLLAKRLQEATSWVKKQKSYKDFSIGYFGASTGAAAALIAAAKDLDVKAVVSRGGRPDLAKEHLPIVKAPTLLIVGGDDFDVITLNSQALALLTCEKKLEIVPGATHLFEEPGTLEKVADLASLWFCKNLSK
jgi:dienelactone hydrolase